ncbi:hypothetical protein BDM02DRAFT_3112178 [Thelephora ganbajun]|uniref:Uncharacterized protein n=1 Tax=Thelephora ganbajun TaxID=370292 RepID=A0ACB6ZKV8_THEGA|nr:hypothetical protein BDM02DRAFT_3112178 [Thelephora ganbajun]
MSISKRLSIAWDGSAPYEDTDTLVLTGRTYFVDVRVKKGSNPPALDWAFAGTRTSTPGAKPGEFLCKWHHLVDSRNSDGSVDEGVVFPHPSDPTKTLERGSMYNPATNRVDPYEEVWLDTVPPPGTQIAFLEKEDGSSFIAIIGELRSGVGKRHAWRVEDGKVICGIGWGEDMHLDLGKGVKGGSMVGPWIVREFWRT